MSGEETGPPRRAPREVSVRSIYKGLVDELGLELLTDAGTLSAMVRSADVHRPGMALMGFTENFLPGRLQVMGESEMAYLASLTTAEQETAVDRVLGLSAPACFITRGLSVPESVLTLAQRRKFPLLRTQMQTVDFINELSRYLEFRFAPREERHGTLVDVYGVGLLFTGRSGIGKSECALDLIERGHRLVADDIVEITRTGEEVIIGRYREVLKHNIEIRGVGVIDVQAIFGIRGIRMQKRIEVEVNLQDWNNTTDYERLGLERQMTEMLGVRIPKVVVPLFPGKNITVIAEVIALDFMLRIYGYDAAQALNQRILDAMHRSDRLSRYLRQDPE